jgi:hypothetical protein
LYTFLTLDSWTYYSIGGGEEIKIDEWKFGISILMELGTRAILIYLAKILVDISKPVI